MSPGALNPGRLIRQATWENDGAGGLFTFDPELVKGHSAPYHPDWKRWGGGNFTLQNQRWVYWPMLKWGDSEHTA